MALLRRLLPFAAVLTAAAAFAPAGGAVPLPSCTPSQSFSLSSAHFTVTFEADSDTYGYATTSLKAGAVLASAERAYAAYAAMGFPAPVTSGGSTNFHILDLTPNKLSSLTCFGNTDFDKSTLDSGDVDYSIAFDVFEQIEWGVSATTDSWLLQEAASWAAWKSLGYPESSVSDLGPYETSLDCYGGTTILCSENGYENNAQSRWPFFEYLAERFGTLFVKDVLVATNGVNSLTALQSSLAVKGTTLAAEYNGYTQKLLAGGWTASALNVASPPTSATVATGATTGDLATQTFGVDHLATRFVRFDRGDGDDSHACYSATLTLTVGIPAGVTSQPVFYWNSAGSTPVQLAVSGSTATATLPWDTCKWASTHGSLALPNASTTTNGTNFTVSGHLTVSTTETTAHPPDAPTNTYGPSTDVPSGDAAPKISLAGAATLKLPATAKEIELVVGANAPGLLRTKLGSVDLGSRTLRPGVNDLHIVLPAAVKLGTSPVTLTVTPASPDGTLAGTTVTRSVVVLADAATASKKTTAKAKKAKAKAKLKRHSK